MRTLYLLRHSLTEANEKRLYAGRSDLPLSPAGRALAEDAAGRLALPECDVYITSGMRRADETLARLTRYGPDARLSDLREMDFGRFEMQCHDALKDDADYQRWIMDETGEVCCPGGESTGAFQARARRGGAALLDMAWENAMVVCHGGVIVALMEMWFPGTGRHFYEWQPAPCRGWRVTFEGRTPVAYEAIQEASMRLGQFQVYTGDGKGKTTAALGLALRAAGAGLRVYIGQFIKSGEFSEIKALRVLPGVTVAQYGSGKGLLIGREAEPADVECARAGLERLSEAMTSGRYDVVIADEIHCAAACGLLSEDDLLTLADRRPGNVELVFTGRGATRAVQDKADLVTEMRAVRHYYADKGLPARTGIEK